MVINIENDNLKKIIKNVINENIDMLEKYQGGQRGLIGFFMKEIMKKSTSSFYSKNSKQKLVLILKTELNVQID